MQMLAIDLAKHVHGVDTDGRVISRRVGRSKLLALVTSLSPRVIAMEACATAHHWARGFLEAGHEVRLINPRFVKPFVRGSKNDAVDAEAIFDAASRPTPEPRPTRRSGATTKSSPSSVPGQETAMTTSDRRAFRRLPISDWPPSLRQAWEAARAASGGLFDDDNPAASWREATCVSVEKGAGLYLRWLRDDVGLDVDPERLVQATTLERIETFVTAYGPGRSQHTVASVLRAVAYLIRAILPPDGLPWLTVLAHRRTNHARPSRPKLPRMASTAALSELGTRLIQQGEAAIALGHRSGTVDIRDGLMIALLIARPMRLRNFAGLRLGRTLLLSDYAIRMVFSAGETKTGREIDMEMPARLTEAMRLYLDRARPILMRGNEPDDGWLWIGRRGRPMKPTDITTRVSLITKRHLGRAVSPHLFRDCAATDIAIHDPQHIGITKDVLGHATLSSSQRFYNQATSLTAFRSHQALIAAQRRGVR